MSKPTQVIDGLLVVDKPAGLTSHDVISRVRRLAGQKRVGHGGTLDPDATGVLVVALGRATKLLTYITGASKTYRATIRLGVNTVTEDASGDWVAAPGCQGISEAQVDAAMEAFVGDILQVPSKVSAIKVGGKRAYAWVRAGEDVELAARPVTVTRFERTSPLRSAQVTSPGLLADSSDGDDGAGDGNGYGNGAADGSDGSGTGGGNGNSVPVVDFDVVVDCSSGTYIRALARDLGADLGCGAHLTALRRTRVGPWTLADAVQLPDLPPKTGKPKVGNPEAGKPEEGELDASQKAPLPETETAETLVLPAYLTLSEAALRVFPPAVLTDSDFQKLAHGVPPRNALAPGEPVSGEIYAAVSAANQTLVGGLLQFSDGRWKSLSVYL